MRATKDFDQPRPPDCPDAHGAADRTHPLPVCATAWHPLPVVCNRLAPQWATRCLGSDSKNLSLGWSRRASLGCQAASRATMLVESVANETLNDSLQSRLAFQSSNDLAAASQHRRTRSEILRDAHIDNVQDRAARETQRADDASARRRRVEAHTPQQHADGQPKAPMALGSGSLPDHDLPSPAVDVARTPSHPAKEAAGSAAAPSTAPFAAPLLAAPPFAAPPFTAPPFAAPPLAAPPLAAPLAATPLGISAPLDPLANSPSGASPSGASPRRGLEASPTNIANLGLKMTSLPPLEQLPENLSPRTAQSPRRVPEMPTITEDPREDDFSPDKPPRNIVRAFEREVYTVETASGRTCRCYEIRWPDGSTRRVFA